MRDMVLLNVDEDRKTQAVRSRTLELAGFRVVNAAPGPSALAAYSPVRNEPVLVVLHGHPSEPTLAEFCACLKAEAGAPLLLLRFVSSGAADAAEWADVCIGEPATETELISAIRSFARIVQQQDTDRRRIEALQLQLAEQRQALEAFRNERQLFGKTSENFRDSPVCFGHRIGNAPPDFRDLPVRARDGHVGGEVRDVEVHSGFDSVSGQRKRIEETLRENERRLRRIAASVPGCVYQFRIDPEGRMSFPFMSDGIANVYGIGAAEAERSAQALFDPIFEADLPMIHASIRRSLENLERWRCEYRIHGPDGALKWLCGESTPQREADGGVLWHGLITDITESRVLQERLRQSHDLLQNVSTQVPGLIYQYQLFPDGRSCFPYASAAIGEIFEVTPEQVREDATPILDRLHSDDYEGIVASVRESARTLEPWRHEFRIVLPRQGLRWRWGDARPQRLADGSVLWHGFTMDITERKRMEEALRASEFALQTADRRKDEFLAMLGHELRNPLAPIRNAAHILNNKEMVRQDPILEWACGMIDRQVIHLVRLVDDLLDVSRLVQGKIVLKEEWVNLVEVVEHAVELGRSLIQDRRQHLSLSLPGAPLYIHGDKVRLTQVMENLLTNAAKYTPEGGRIRLYLDRQDREAVIRIRDTGLGIAADLLPHIFDLFTQAQQDLARRQGGLGIGLTVVKGLVQLHKGRIEARSDGLGKGSEFIVRLPSDGETAGEPGASAVAEAPPTAPVARRLLVVDDNADALESLAVLLKLKGHTVKTAPDGPTALETARHFQPDIILLDIGLPGMDGYEVARRFRALDATRDTLLVAVTGYGQQGDRLRARAAGFDHYFVKPIDLVALQRLLFDLGGPGENSLR
jgi:signal transduction histidine kinase/DNA-binding response OmpR family regulator